jgi:hypothetical protein
MIPRSRIKVVAAIGAVATIVVVVLVGRMVVGREPSFNPATLTCDDHRLTKEAIGMVEGSNNPLRGKLSILKAKNYRPNPAYGKAQYVPDYLHSSTQDIMANMFADRKHQCAATIITNHGDMTMYYGWQVSDGDFYIETNAVPD